MKFHTSPIFAAFLLASPLLSAGQIVTSQTVISVWYPEGGPATITPAPVMADVFGLGSNTTFTVTPRNTSDGNFWNGVELTYVTTTVLSINYVNYLWEKQTCPETICTGTINTLTISAACTSMSGATTARCTGSYGTVGHIWTSTMGYSDSTSTRTNTKRKVVSTYSDVRPFPSEPTVKNMLALTVTAGSLWERPTTTATTSSSTGGAWAPRQTCNEILVGAAAAVAGGAALLL